MLCSLPVRMLVWPAVGWQTPSLWSREMEQLLAFGVGVLIGLVLVCLGYVAGRWDA